MARDLFEAAVRTSWRCERILTTIALDPVLVHPIRHPRPRRKRRACGDRSTQLNLWDRLHGYFVG